MMMGVVDEATTTTEVSNLDLTVRVCVCFVCLQHWNRRWFVLDGSKLYYLKDDASRQKMLICDVLLCTVKVGQTFSLLSPLMLSSLC